ncbi:MAG: circularly permuted type 2 ATP-grasp protein [Deltaproteobacteria bacterium]|nr:MAG: circularly permuted type 2 ATP-grasp protein [Deltaproteobacteria bacterium]
MNFATYIRPWLDEMRAQKETIIRRGAIDKLTSLLAEQRAHKTPVLPIPLTFDRAAFDALAAAGRLIASAQTKIVRQLMRDHTRVELLRRFHIPEAMEPTMDWDELVTGAHVIARFDVVPSSDGFYFCEYNRDSSVGGTEISDCLQVFCNAMRWPITEHMASPQQACVRLLRRLAQERGLERIVLCDWSANRGSGYFGFDLLRQHLTRALPELEIRLVYETEYPEAWLDPREGRRILVHRGFMYQDITDGGAFMRRLRDSGATIINAFETEILMNKRFFAMFCDPKYQRLFTAEERDAIARYVPHTVAVTRDNLDELLRNKAELVFKLGASYGGHDVMMGAEHSAEQLRSAIEAKAVEEWIAQKVIAFEGIDLPFTSEFEFTNHNVVFGLYLIDGEASGLTVRASGRKVVALQSGAGGYTWAVPMSADERAQAITAIRQIAEQP